MPRQKGDRTREFLERVFPSGEGQSPGVKKAKLICDAGRILAEMREARLDDHLRPKWYEHLAGLNDPLGEAIRAVGYTVFLKAVVDGDTAAAKLFMDCYNKFYRPQTNLNIGGQADNPVRVIRTSRRAECPKPQDVPIIDDHSNA